MPTSVRAHCLLGRWHDIEVEDDVTAFMTLESGATATFISSTGEAPGVNRLEVSCERGLLRVDNDGLSWTRTEQEVSTFCSETDQAFGKPPIWEVKIPVQGGNGPQHAGILH